MLTLLLIVSIIFMIVFIISAYREDSALCAALAFIFGIATFFLLIAVCYQSYQVFCRANTISA